MSADYPLSDRQDHAERFLNALFPFAEEDERITIWRASDKRSQHYLPSGLQKAAAYASSLEDDVFVGMATRPPGLPSGSRGGNSDVVRCGALWLDIDIAGPNHKTGKVVESIDDARKLVDQFPLPYSMAVRTGGGVHVYWLLAEPVDGNELEDLLRLWGDWWLWTAERLGVAVDDGVWTADRVMRVPGTFNRKNGGTVPVTLQRCLPDKRYHRDDIEERLGTPDEWKRPQGTSKRKAGGSTGWGDLTDDEVGKLHPKTAYALRVMCERFGALDPTVHTRDGGASYVEVWRPDPNETYSAKVGWTAPGVVTVWSSNWPPFVGGGRNYPLELLQFITDDDEVVTPEALQERSRERAERLTEPTQSGSVGSVRPFERAPIPFQGNEVVPPFPLDVLPWAFRQWVEAEATATQTPPDLAAMLALAVLAAAAAKRVRVVPTPGWVEPVNLYVVVALPSGERKSAVFRDATYPLRLLEDQQIELVGPLRAEALQRQRIAEGALKKAEASAMADSTNPVLLTEAESARRILEAVSVPAIPRLMADDTTPEALVTLLQEQDGRIAVMAPEGRLFDIAAGLYSAKGSPPNYDVLLRGHAGDPITVDRKSRGPERVADPAVTLGLAVQPHKLDELAAVPGARDSGLLARMLVAVPRSFVGFRDVFAAPVGSDIATAYADAVLEVAERLDNAEITVTLAPGAGDAFDRWREQIELDLRPGGRLDAISREWGSKLPGAVARVAGILHVVEYPMGDEINLDVMQRAIRFGEYLIGHAAVVYGRLAADAGVSLAAKSVPWLRQRLRDNGDVFSVRDFQRLRGVERVEAAQLALDLLEDNGYVRRLPQGKPGPQGGRRPSPEYEINPLLNRLTQPTEPSCVSSDDRIGQS